MKSKPSTLMDLSFLRQCEVDLILAQLPTKHNIANLSYAMNIPRGTLMLIYDTAYNYGMLKALCDEGGIPEESLLGKIITAKSRLGLMVGYRPDREKAEEKKTRSVNAEKVEWALKKWSGLARGDGKGSKGE